MKTRNRLHRAVVFTFAAVCAVGTGWATNTWQAVDGEWSGDWSETAHWSAGHEPTADEDVLLPAHDTNYAVTATNAISVGSFTVGTEDVSVTGTATFVASTLGTNLVARDCVVWRKGELTHAGPWTTAQVKANQHARLNFKVDGNMTVAKNGEVTGTGKGYAYGSGQAIAQVPGHGGLSGNNICYGSVRFPTTFGTAGSVSQAMGHGGGAIYLDVAGSLLVDGKMTVKAGKRTSGTQSGTTGAGGSIFVKSGTFSGSGSLDASGTSGGRIAVYQRAADGWSGCTGTMSAVGDSSWKLGGGTIYKETKSQRGCGDLICDLYSETRFNSDVQDWQAPYDSVTAKEVLRVTGDLTVKTLLKVSGDSKSALIVSGTLTLAPTNGGTTAVSIASGKTCQANAIICEAPGATLQFEPNSVLTVPAKGILTLMGSEEEPLVLRSKTTGSQWKISAGANFTPSVRWLTVSDGYASTTPITAYDSENAGHNTSWTFVDTPKPGATMTWTGAADSQFANPLNWDPARDVLETDVLVLTNGCARYPEVAKSFVANRLEMEDGTVLTLTGADMSVTNTVVSSGTVAGSGVLRLVGACSTADLGNGRYAALSVDKPEGGELMFAKGFDVGVFSCHATAPLSLRFAPGETVSAEALHLDGLCTPVGGGDPVTNLTLCSSTASSSWLLKATGVIDVRGAFVSDSDASGGKELIVGGLCIDSGRNRNWDFNPSASASWMGLAGDGKFRNAANWAPSFVPNADTHVTISASAGVAMAVTVDAGDPVEVKELVLGGDAGTVSFRSDAKLLVHGELEVGAGVTCALNYLDGTNEVKGSVSVRQGAVLTHTANPAGNTARYRLALAVGGNMTVDGSINVDGNGFAAGYGPGHNDYYPSSYGGLGGNADKSTSYGSVYEPSDLGSGANRTNASGCGGGAVFLDVVGTLTLNGSVTALSGGADNQGWCTGGSIYLRAGTIVGAGQINASSLNAGAWQGGGGGRIALYQTQAKDWSRQTGTVKADGAMKGSNIGGAGTIYRQHAGQKPRGGEIEVKGNYGRTLFPMPSDGDPCKAHADASLSIDYASASSGNGLLINTDGIDLAKDKIRLGDLNLKTAKSYVSPNGATVKVKSSAHKDGKKWGADKATLVVGPGDVVWSTGLLIGVR